MANSAIADSVALGGGRSGNGGALSGNGGRGGESSGAAGVPQRAYATGMMIALGGIMMFFLALVSAWVVRGGLANSNSQPLNVPRILWLNTAILFGSSFTLARSRRSLRAQQEDGVRHWWGATAILGVLFLCGQVIAWRQLAAAGMFLATNPSSSFFYVFTAAHGLHLLGGIAALLTVAFRTTRRVLRATAVDVVAIYWHAMDALWLFLFLFFKIVKWT